jgi:hypothetical protein
MTSHVAQEGRHNAQASDAMLRASGLRAGERVAVDRRLDWQLWIPESFDVSWTSLDFFWPSRQSPPAGVSVVEMRWKSGQSARDSWPDAPPGWRIVGSDQGDEWVVWRKEVAGTP